MSRSVSYPHDSLDIVYLDRTDSLEDGVWDDVQDGIVYALTKAFPSLEACNRWIGQENHAILENGLCEFTISGYNGLVAVAVRVRDHCDRPELARSWAASIGKKLRKAFDRNRLVLLGTASNGESFYKRINQIGG